MSVSPVEACGDRVKVAPLPPKDLTCTKLLQTAKGIISICNVLYIKGYTGLGDVSLAKGLIGYYNPVKVRALGSETYVTLPPGVRRDITVVDYCTLLYPSVAFPVVPAMMMKLRVAAVQPPTMTSTRGRSGRASMGTQGELLSALTSAMSATSRA